MELCDSSLYEEFIKYVNDLGGDIQGKRKVRAAFAGSNSTWGEKPLPCNYLPFLGSMPFRDKCVESGNILYSILKKIIGQYRINSSYRRLFSFDSRVEELIMLPNTCGEELPFLRVDFIFSDEEEKMVFCEFNTDACGGMVEQKTAIKALVHSEVYNRFSQKHTIKTDEELPYQGWVDAYTSMYRRYLIDKVYTKNANNNIININDNKNTENETKSCLAIVVCFDSPKPDVSMFLDFVPYFNRAGFRVSIFDVRQLSFDGEHLHGKKSLYGEGNMDIDCIWKFCVTVDLLQHWEDVQPFIKAMGSGKVFAAGAFSTQLAHDKQIMAVMHHPQTQVLLTAREREFIAEHIPYTVLLENLAIDNGHACSGTDQGDTPTIREIKGEPAKWILKPADWYASIDVIAGRSCSQQEWAAIIEKYLSEEGSGKHWLLQRFYPPGKVPSIPLYGHEADYTAPVQQYGNMFGIFMHSGEYGGVFLRQGPGDVIGDSTGGVNGAVLWVE